MAWLYADTGEQVLGGAVYKEAFESARNLVPDWTSDAVDCGRARRIFLAIKPLVTVAGGVGPGLVVQGNVPIVQGAPAEWVDLAYAEMDDEVVIVPATKIAIPASGAGIKFWEIFGLRTGVGGLLTDVPPVNLLRQIRLDWDSGTGTPTAGNAHFKFIFMV